jgi:ligand-binding sensor domain-containing protein
MLDGDDWKEFYRSNQPFRYFHFENLYLDSSNRLWAIIQLRAGFVPDSRPEGFALWYYDNESNQWKDFLNIDGAPNKKVTDIFEASSGDLWFNTNKGIHKFDGTKWIAFNKDNGLKGNHYTAIGEDSEGNIWLGLGDEGLKGDGLAVYDGNNWKYYDSSNRLPSDRVFSIIGDDGGNVWIGTFKGVVKHAP